MPSQTKKTRAEWSRRRRADRGSLGLGLIGLVLACTGEPARREPAAANPRPRPVTAVAPQPPADAALETDVALDSPRILVDVSEFIPDAVLDIRYATANNFVGVALYDQATCLLRPEVAKRLRRAAALLRKRGYRLRLWDCYRPFSVQEALYRKVSDPRYVGKPKRGADGKPLKGSRHNRGAAVDVSLVTIDGKYVRMPTDYDDFSRRAHRSELAKGGKGAGNARVLEAAMSEAGFVGLATEWWHFDAEGWQRFALLDIAFQDLN